MTAADDELHMRRAIALAQARLGLTAPNPSVGCIIVRGGQVVGEGVTGEGGRPHAEEAALNQAGAFAAGATAYVTLEPCGERSSGGLSCAVRLIEAGVARVVIACTDASAYASGRGSMLLDAAGVAVETEVLAGEAGSLLYSDYRPHN